tara:strand:- start:634 stop:1404 length:771 start_codon:yes stop_codon:yes gene_type:complete
MTWELIIKESKWVKQLSESKKKLLNSTPSFDVDFPELKHPSNKSEIPKVKEIMENYEVDDKLLEELDQNNHQLLLEIVDEKKSDWEDFIRDTDIHILKLKMKYKRPRPYEISNEINSVTDTDNSPSFPSGHASESHALAKVLANKYPEKEEELFNMAKAVGMSRIMMGNHYPSDVDAGEKVGLLIADAYLSQIKKSEDWRKDTRGDMEVSELIIMIQQALFYYEELLKKLEEKPVDLESIKEMVRDVIRILKEELN